MFSGADAPWHWLILIILVVALFGYKKLPDAARSLGRSMRIFKTEIKGMTEDDAARDARAHGPAAPAVVETNFVKQAPISDVVPSVDTPVATPTVAVPSPNTSSPNTFPPNATPPSSAGAVQATTPGTV